MRKELEEVQVRPVVATANVVVLLGIVETRGKGIDELRAGQLAGRNVGRKEERRAGRIRGVRPAAGGHAGRRTRHRLSGNQEVIGVDFRSGERDAERQNHRTCDKSG